MVSVDSYVISSQYCSWMFIGFLWVPLDLLYTSTDSDDDHSVDGIRCIQQNDVLYMGDYYNGL